MHIGYDIEQTDHTGAAYRIALIPHYRNGHTGSPIALSPWFLELDEAQWFRTVIPNDEIRDIAKENATHDESPLDRFDISLDWVEAEHGLVIERGTFQRETHAVRQRQGGIAIAWK